MPDISNFLAWAGLLVYLGLALVPATIARRKGYSGVAFYFFGLAALLIAIIVALSIRPKAALPTLTDHLNGLDQLRAAGRISEEEYQRQRARMVR